MSRRPTALDPAKNASSGLYDDISLSLMKPLNERQLKRIIDNIEKGDPLGVICPDTYHLGEIVRVWNE